MYIYIYDIYTHNPEYDIPYINIIYIIHGFRSGHLRIQRLFLLKEVLRIRSHWVDSRWQHHVAPEKAQKPFGGGSTDQPHLKAMKRKGQFGGLVQKVAPSFSKLCGDLKRTYGYKPLTTYWNAVTCWIPRSSQPAKAKLFHGTGCSENAKAHLANGP